MQQEQLQKYINDGLSVRKISKQAGICQQTVMKYLKKYRLKTITKIAHPNLKLDYFQNIDSPEKAYWLGFLYADGCMRKTGNTFGFKLELATKDEIQIDNFCKSVGAELSRKTYCTRLNKYYAVCIGIYNQEFNKNLIKQGCEPQKTFRIKHPNFNNETLNYAFLLGFYDGDGTVGGTITCGNKSFLSEIANRYGLQKYLKFNKKVPSLRLPRHILEKMFESYSQSMERKKKFTTLLSYKQKHGHEYKAKTKIVWPSIEELKKLVWEKPTQTIALFLGVSDKAIEKHCKKLNISKPPRGYWTKLKMAGNTGVESA